MISRFINVASKGYGSLSDSGSEYVDLLCEVLTPRATLLYIQQTTLTTECLDSHDAPKLSSCGDNEVMLFLHY